MARFKPLAAGATALFLIAETLLGIRFQTGGEYGRLLRFFTVALACLFCVFLAERSWEYLLTQAALLLTVCADCFLVLPPSPNQLPGMLFFSAAQLVYAVRLYRSETSPTRRRGQVISRVCLSALGITATALVLGQSTDAVALVSLFYYGNLILNVVFAWMQTPRQLLLAAGFTLFLLCDTLVGFAFLDGYLTVEEGSLIHRINHPGFDLAWAFYLPSQMLLAVSLLPARWRKNRTATSPSASVTDPSAPERSIS